MDSGLCSWHLMSTCIAVCWSTGQSQRFRCGDLKVSGKSDPLLRRYVMGPWARWIKRNGSRVLRRILHRTLDFVCKLSPDCAPAGR